jgi:hypothetical protein
MGGGGAGGLQAGDGQKCIEADGEEVLNRVRETKGWE